MSQNAAKTLPLGAYPQDPHPPLPSKCSSLPKIKITNNTIQEITSFVYRLLESSTVILSSELLLCLYTMAKEFIQKLVLPRQHTSHENH